mmetsp:Transcript_8965/g.29611  ORF Transcript_8965/g.29611 Transcript_8965/m.29611 type:complete len:278 (-) Transcript_8965:815-1648(-)
MRVHTRPARRGRVRAAPHLNRGPLPRLRQEPDPPPGHPLLPARRRGSGLPRGLRRDNHRRASPRRLSKQEQRRLAPRRGSKPRRALPPLRAAQPPGAQPRLRRVRPRGVRIGRSQQPLPQAGAQPGAGDRIRAAHLRHPGQLRPGQQPAPCARIFQRVGRALHRHKGVPRVQRRLLCGAALQGPLDGRGAHRQRRERGEPREQRRRRGLVAAADHAPLLLHLRLHRHDCALDAARHRARRAARPAHLRRPVPRPQGGEARRLDPLHQRPRPRRPHHR